MYETPSPKKVISEKNNGNKSPKILLSEPDELKSKTVKENDNVSVKSERQGLIDTHLNDTQKSKADEAEGNINENTLTELKNDILIEINNDIN